MKTQNLYTRRTTLKAVALGVAAAYSGQMAFAQQKLRTRRSLHGMALDDPDLSTYRDFVGLMKSYPQNQPLSWLGFSLPHGWVSDDFQQGDYKFCPHGDWYFLPWHRAYTLMYEQAAQTLLNNPAFAMPYWDWTLDRQLPEAFAEPLYKGKTNPLYVPNRNQLIGQNALTDKIVGQAQMDKIYAETDYELFGTSRSVDFSDPNNPVVQDNLDPKWVPIGGGNQGPLENPPHNQVHNRIGVYMPSPGSPRDPIFFMHHSNIDRIWAYWNALGRKNSSDPLWLNMPFTDNYIDPKGQPYTKVVKDLQNTADYGYTYPDLPAPDGKTPDPDRAKALLVLHSKGVGAKIEGVQRVGGANKIAALASAALQSPHALAEGTLKTVTNPQAAKRPREVFAIIKNLVIGNGIDYIRVFINKKGLSLETPDTDPHFVRDVSFLAHPKGTLGADGHRKSMHSNSVLVDLTHTIKALGGLGRLDKDDIIVQLQPVPKPGLALEQVGKVVPASIEVVVL